MTASVDPLIAYAGGITGIERLLCSGALLAARLLPLTILAPWLSLRATPSLVRGAVTVVLAMALTPIAVSGSESLPFGALWFLLAILREVLVGVVFALAAALPLHAIQWAGQLTDTWRGASLSAVLAPDSGENASPIGDLYLMTAVVLFFLLGGHRVAIAAFAGGLEAMPLGGSIHPAGLSAVAVNSARLLGHALAFSAALAAPVAATLVLAELALGLLGRAAPQIPLFFAAMPLRAGLGILAALLALSLLMSTFGHQFARALETAGELVGRLAP